MGWRELRLAQMNCYATAWLELDNEKLKNKTAILWRLAKQSFKCVEHGFTGLEDDMSMMNCVPKIFNIFVQECYNMKPLCWVEELPREIVVERVLKTSRTNN